MKGEYMSQNIEINCLSDEELAKKIKVVTRSDKVNLIVSAANMYRTIIFKNHLYNEIANIDKISREDYNYCRYCEMLIESTDEDIKRIILNDYFYKLENKKPSSLWYLEYYNKATYFQLKNKAINKFYSLLRL